MADPTSARDRCAVVAPWIEWALAGLILAALALDAWRFALTGHPPAPFFYDHGDALMDWFDPAWWGRRGGAYTVWRSIYPPLSFVFLQGVTLGRCYAGSALAARDCDWLSTAVLIGFHLLNGVLILRALRRADPATAVPRAVALWLGLPMLYALDRGNLLIPCFTAFVLAQGELLRGRVARWAFLATSLNFKPYLLLMALPYLARRDWRWLAGCGVAGLVLYLVTLAIAGAGTPAQLLDDLGAFTRGVRGSDLQNLYYSTSWWPLARLVAHGGAAGLPPPLATATAAILVGAMRLAQVGTTGAILLALARPDTVRTRPFAALCAGLVLTTVTNGASGYTQIFLFLLLFLEPGEGAAGAVVLIGVYLLSLPLDLPLTSAVAGSPVSEFGVSLGQLLRPGLLLAVQGALIAINLREGLRKAPAAAWAAARLL